MVNSKLSKGQKYLRRTLDVSGNVLSTTSSLLGTAIAVKTAKNKELERIAKNEQAERLARGEQPDKVEKIEQPENLTKIKSAVDSSNTLVKESAKINTTISSAKAQRRPGELDYMDDQELRDRVARMTMEQQYKTITSAQVAKGKVDVKRVMEVAGSVVAITSSIIGIATAIKGLKAGNPEIPKTKIPPGIKGV